MDFSTSCDDSWSIFSLTDNLSSSPRDIDASSLLCNCSDSMYPIGMSNFRAKTKHTKMRLNASECDNESTISSRNAKRLWRVAVEKAKLLRDPWAEFHIETYKEEVATRHRYNAIQKKWISDECVVKVETRAFAHGAMRACYRLKKLSNFVHKPCWESASNYVAKCYMDAEVPRERYFDDVKLQMDAKLYAEEYNRHNPPKKIDMFQMSIVEFKNRPDSPLFHLEHFIEGTYTKYNSNSGYVVDDDEHVRNTPQAFSHFTFESSFHKLIVVDIQGVGDLYTDPQIHTCTGTEYGDGNLGTKGMALFFNSHVCNDICRSLGLSHFDLAEGELSKQNKFKSLMNKCSALTKRKGREEICVGSPSNFSNLRLNFKSQCSIESDDLLHELHDFIDESEGYESSASSASPQIISSSPHSHSLTSQQHSTTPICIPNRQRVRNESHCLDSVFSSNDALNYFDQRAALKPRASCVNVERDRNENDLCKYHEMGRFVNEGEEFDLNAAFYHLEQAANLGNIEALTNIAKIYLNVPHDVLPNYELSHLINSTDTSFDYMYEAAQKGDKSSILYVAKAFDTGVGLRKDLKKNWISAIEWYQELLKDTHEMKSDDDGYSSSIDQTDEPDYIILARIAEMYSLGEHGLCRDLNEAYDLYNEAGERATACGKGRLANKYYMIAETLSADL